VPFPEPGARLLDRFVLERPLASGAMGEVWVAKVVNARDRVAVKVCGGGGRERARREAEALALLDHPNVVRHLASGEVDDHVVLVMELVDGTPLSRVLKAAPPDPATALSYTQQLCAALVHAHGRGVVHRDVKASNVLLSRSALGRDRLVLIDFGLGLVEGRARVSSSDIVLGSVHTMPPEQLAGETSDGRADVYSLMALLFRMLCGRYPYHAASSVQVLAMHAHAKVPSLADRAEAPLRVPAALPQLMTRCLSKDPERRPHAQELLAELEALPAETDGAWIDIEPASPVARTSTDEGPGPGPARSRVSPWAVGLGLLAVVAVVLSLWWVL